MTIAVIVLGGILLLLLGVLIGFHLASTGIKTVVARMTDDERRAFRAATGRAKFEAPAKPWTTASRR